MRDKIPREPHRAAGTLGSGLGWTRPAGLETGETADLEVGATTNAVHPTDAPVKLGAREQSQFAGLQRYFACRAGAAASRCENVAELPGKSLDDSLGTVFARYLGLAHENQRPSGEIYCSSRESGGAVPCHAVFIVLDFARKPISLTAPKNRIPLPLYASHVEIYESIATQWS
jgi:hypothetical protein